MNIKWDALTRDQKNEILEHYDVMVTSDNKNFQQKARLLQSVWREEKGLPIGTHKGKDLGSRLDSSRAEADLLNFLTSRIRKVVTAALDSNRSGLMTKKRLFKDLLSSQPLCFNLFGELTCDLPLATRVFSDLTDGRIAEVTNIQFEYSPGRKKTQYTGDSSAFDVYLKYTTKGGAKGFVGVEVKYHENPNTGSKEGKHYNNHGKRYEEIADMMNCFSPENLDIVRRNPIQQFWRDHLLVGIHKRVDHFVDAFFAVLHPEGNEACDKAVSNYRNCLVHDCESFRVWTLEMFVDCLRKYSPAGWIDNFYSRYLDFERLPTSVHYK